MPPPGNLNCCASVEAIPGAVKQIETINQASKIVKRTEEKKFERAIIRKAAPDFVGMSYWNNKFQKISLS